MSQLSLKMIRHFYLGNSLGKGEAKFCRTLHGEIQLRKKANLIFRSLTPKVQSVLVILQHNNITTHLSVT